MLFLFLHLIIYLSFPELTDSTRNLNLNLGTALSTILYILLLEAGELCPA
jgi:hypothetical protein